MILLMLTIFVVMILYVALKLTEVVLSAAIWFLVKIPLALVLFCIGIVFCCTLIFIPIGLGLIKHAICLFVPGV